MKLEAIVTSNAFVELAEPERDALVTRLGSGLELDASAVAHLDGDAANLSATDLRRCLLAWGVQPFSFVSLDPPPPIATEVCERLLLLLDAERAGGEPGPELVEQARELGQRVACAELARAELGFVPDVLLGALELAIDAWVARASRGCFEADAVHQALVGAGLEPLSEAILDYHRRTTGLHAWFDRLGRHAATALSDTRHGLLMLVAGKPEHEGHFDGSRWRNWSGSEQIQPRRFVVPENEPAIIEAVRSARRLRVVGGGHSFNGSPLCADTMLSLDACRRVLALDRQQRVIRVEAGLRLRDLSRILAANGLALPVLGSTDAQSIGGLVATDLHGTGREHGFLSQQIRSLRVVSAAGHARTVRPGEPLFHAAVGGLGALGVVTEVELSLVPAFNLAKSTRLVDRRWAEGNIDRLLAEHDHVSFYYPAGSPDARSVRLHTWDRTDEAPAPDWREVDVRHELEDFALSAYLPDVAELVGEQSPDAPIAALLAPATRLVAPSAEAFGRKLYYRHDEIEFGVPFERYRDVLDRVLSLLAEEDYFSIVEVRFTPDASQAMLGPGVGRRTAYIELATPMSRPTAGMYARVEQIFLENGGRPHLGKYCGMSPDQMLKAFGDRYVRFQDVRRAEDPENKFLSGFTEQIF